MTIIEKVAYIQGLFDGMDLDKSESKEARILSEMLDLFKEIGEELETVDATLDEFSEEIDAISDDLADVESVVYEDEDEDEDEDEEDEYPELDCPNCGEILVIDDDVVEAGTIDCPNCGEKFALSCDCDCGDCDCDCE